MKINKISIGDGELTVQQCKEIGEKMGQKLLKLKTT